MRALFDALSSVVIRRPVAVIVATLVATVLLGVFNGQMVTDDGVAVDNELRGPRHDRRGVRRPAVGAAGRRGVARRGDVRSVDGCGLARDPGGDRSRTPSPTTLIDREGQPPVASFLGGAEQAVERPVSTRRDPRRRGGP
jgi:hypothetical protein